MRFPRKERSASSLFMALANPDCADSMAEQGVIAKNARESGLC
jgi:hypothetical protein